MSRVSKTERCAHGEATIMLIMTLSLTLRDVCKTREINVSATTSDPMSEGDVATTFNKDFSIAFLKKKDHTRDGLAVVQRN